MPRLFKNFFSSGDELSVTINSLNFGSNVVFPLIFNEWGGVGCRVQLERYPVMNITSTGGENINPFKMYFI